MQELLEKGPNGKTKPRVELLLAKENGVVSNLLCEHWIPLH